MSADGTDLQDAPPVEAPAEGKAARPLRRWLLRLRVVVPAVLVMGVGLYVLMSVAVVYGGTRPEHNPFEAYPEDFGLAYEDVSFTPRGENITLRGWLLNGTPGAPYLIFVHGIGDQRTGNDALDIASRLLRDKGYNILLFDLRAEGTSGGGLITAGQKEQLDVLGAYDFVVSRGAEPGRVGLISRSYGAGTSIMAAPREPGIGALVADSPFADAQEFLAQEVARKTPIPKAVVSTLVPGARFFADLLYGIHLGDLKPERAVSKITYPILIIHGEADERVPVEQGRRVYAAAPAGSELWTLPGVTHCQAFQTQPDEYIRRVEAYLETRFETLTP
jgi:pimeloyl-ACP methyl ester carboxylesterase